MRKARRNDYLLQAAAAMGEKSAPELHARLDVFLARGEWRRWKSRRDPPEGTGPLLSALFYVAKLTAKGEPLSVRQIARILQDKNSPGNVHASTPSFIYAESRRGRNGNDHGTELHADE